MSEKVKTVIEFYFLLPDLESRGHPRLEWLGKYNISTGFPQPNEFKFENFTFHQQHIKDFWSNQSLDYFCWKQDQKIAALKSFERIRYHEVHESTAWEQF